ncbi:hybrid sensor histidine kinase/response regulator transcription factor [Marinilabilia rubra]|nr:hybrid sensor histidine kinase/response regulator transcription factor [Marinilabilia rubra]
MKCFLRIGFLALLLLLNIKGEALEFKNLGTDDGLNAGYVNDFVKDSLGYMWIATANGINRYSGYEFKSYDIRAFSSCKNKNAVRLLNLEGDIYVFLKSGGILKYDYEQDDFTEIKRLSQENVITASEFGDGFLVGLSDGMLYWDLKSDKIQGFNEFGFLFVRRIIASASGAYIATSRGVFKLGKQDKGGFEVRDSILYGKDIIDIVFDQKQRLWIGTEKSGLFVISSEEEKKIDLFNESLKNYTVRSIAFNKQNEAFVAVDRLGLFKIGKNDEIEAQYTHDPNKTKSLRQNSIHNIYIDEKGVCWLAAGDLGIDLLYSKDNPFLNIRHVLNDENSLANNSVRAIFKDLSDNVWFGTENGVSCLSPGGQWIHYNKSLELASTPVLAINEYEGDLVLGTYGEGLLKINKQEGRIETFFGPDQSPLDLIFTIFVDGDELWIGGNDGSICFYKNGRINHRVEIGQAKAIIKGLNERIYVASVTGVFEINKRNFSQRRIAGVSSEKGNSINNAFSLCLDSLRNCLWIGTDLGLHRYDLRVQELVSYSPAAHQETGTVYSIQLGDDHDLWLGTTHGLFRFNPEVKDFRLHDYEDGVCIDEFGFGATNRFRDGTLGFGGPEGAVLFNPKDIERDTVVSELFISEFLINGAKPEPDIVSGNINFKEEIELPYNYNSLSFTFEVVKFHGSRKNKFVWQLDGYDQVPFASKGNRVATYPKLDPGNYLLKAKVFDAEGVRSEKNIILGIKIHKPWWLRWWAIMLYVIVSALLLYLIVILERAKAHQRFSDEKVKFFVNLAHDIRTPVSLIQLSAEQLVKHENFENAVKLIYRNTQSLSQYVSQLLDFQKSEQKKVKLKVEEVDIKLFLESIVEEFNPLLQQKSIDLFQNIPNAQIWVDKEKMGRVFNNLISNAIKYTEEGGEINIDVEKQPESINIIIEDNGIGIPEKQQKMIFERFTRADNVMKGGFSGIGIGLMLSKRFVELHHGEIHVISKEKIGSKFIVSLPVGTGHFNENEIFIPDHNLEIRDFSDQKLSGNKLVLIVEDNDDLRGVLKSELELFYKVIEASNGKDGLFLALKKNPDLVITDVMMPKMSGKELCHILKQDFKTSHIPVVMITALSGFEDKVEGIEVGADAYVEKPFNMEVLNATINNLIRSRYALNQLRKKVDKEELQASSVSPDEDFLSRAFEIIKENISNPDFNIDVLCEKLGFSRSNLFRKLKGLTGLSPSDLIIKMKLNNAVELMDEGKEQRIGDIAFESGFHDPKYFSTLFKKKFGKTPKEYMEGLRK